MAKDVLDQICGLLKSPDAELQCAAARVLGALKTTDAAAREALIEALKSGNQMVVSYAVDALGRHAEAAVLPHLIQVFGAASAARDRAVAAVVAFGEASAPALRKELKSKNAAVRRGVLEALAQVPGDACVDDLLEGLFDLEDEVVQFATATVRSRIQRMGDKERSALLGRARKLLDRPGTAKSVPALTALMKLLGFLRIPDAAPQLLARLDRKFPTPVRKNALVSLEHLDLSGVDPKAAVNRLLPLLQEADLANIVSPALSVLGKVELPKALASKLMALRKSPHPAVRVFAVRAMGATGTAQAADALVAMLGSEDFRDRETASISLRGNAAFAPRLVSEIEKAKDLAYAWSIAEVLRSYRDALPKPLAKRLLARGLRFLAKQDEERAKAFIEAARQAAPEAARAALLKGGTAWLRRRRFETAEGYLRYLERDDLATPEGLYALALARLKRASTSLDPVARGKNPALPLLVRLVRRGDFPVARRLAADRKLLTPGDLLYVGFHFLDQQGAGDRVFGGEVLKLLARTYPKSAEAASAKKRLATEGF